MTSTRVLLRYAAAAVLLATVVGPVTPASATTGQPRLVAYDYMDPTTLEDRTATINVDNGQRAPLYDNIHSPAWSPDGTRLAFAKDDLIGIVNADGTTITGADHPEAYTLSLTWSPDGNFIAYDVGPGDQIWITTTTAPFVTHRIPNVRGSSPSWSPDGTRIAYQQTSGNLGVVNVDGNHNTTITTARRDRAPAWSPDGSQIAYFDFVSGHQGLWLVRPDGTGAHRIFVAARQDAGPTWSPDSTEIAFNGAPHAYGPGQLIIVRTNGVKVHAYPNVEARHLSWRP